MSVVTPIDIRVFRLRHRGEEWIGIGFDYDSGTIAKIKTIPGRKYSATHKCWYIPRTREAFEAFKSLQLPYTFQEDNTSTDQSTNTGHAQEALPEKHQSGNGNATLVDSRLSDSVEKRASKSTSDIFHTKTGKLHVQFSKKYFYFTVPYDKSLIERVKQVKKTWWNKDLKKWIAYGSEENLLKIQEVFGCWTEEQLNRIREIIRAYESPKRVTFYRLPDETERIAVEVTGFGVDHQVLHKISGREYQKAFKRWIIPNDPGLIQRLTDYYSERQTEVTNRLPSAVGKKAPREMDHREKQLQFLKRFGEGERQLLKQMSDVMIRQRYSWRSIRSYCGALIKFLDYTGKAGIEDCGMEEVQGFLTYVSKQDISDSLLNGYVSALKFYYGRVANRPDMIISSFRRPRKRKVLPTILSVAEVRRMIQVTDNLKHKTILYAIYSSGLRLGELIHLKLDDIRWDRSQIFIRQAKGKKDRMVMLSEVLKKALQLYCQEYKPGVYLFESTVAGKPYSPKSVQKVVKKAAKRANISQRVTPHVLRHCFATHLLDSGTNIRLIQELLGHKDIKTTLIYTHVSTEQATAVQSPLDRMGSPGKNTNK